ncbi:MAG: DUF1415 domain-containing protein [Pseudomonadota bacterium]
MINQTKKWLDEVIIAHNICPFAKKERDSDKIRFFVDQSIEVEQALENLIIECQHLDNDAQIETTLFIISRLCQDFNDYLYFLDLAKQLLHSMDYEGIYQLASFHPDYCFADSPADDAANYTNRSPYPMLHIIREQSLENALLSYSNPELIPERNISYCRKLGVKKMQQMLNDCIGQQP